jgi:cytochrome c peroxidase
VPEGADPPAVVVAVAAAAGVEGASITMAERALICLVLAVVLGSTSVCATEADIAAWRSFQHALGQPALVGANADHELASTAYRPVPAFAEGDFNAGKFRLGFFLFHEGRLSSNGRVACVTCHAGPLSGVDGRRVSLGVDNARGQFNALTTFNAAYHFRQFWDGRAVTLEDQAREPIVADHEMANTLEAVVAMLQNDAQYAARFAAVYPDGVSIDNMADAIAHFQRINFNRPDSPFLRHLAGEANQLGGQALRGWLLFDDIGCASCHNGISLGGNSYQQLGAALPFYDEHRAAQPHDEGVQARSGRDEDIHVFKVPSLHTAATTAPYFHDGSIPTLEAAITEMARHQLGRELSEPEINDIAAFLRALSPPFTPVPVDFTVTDDAAAAHGVDSLVVRQSHHEAYAAAIEAIAPAQRGLLEEMRRIQSGEVAHFDFLQFQHLELIRHARALHHPPSHVDRQLRDRLVAGAEALLSAVNALEWTIADFLRAQAMTWVLVTHLDNPEQGRLAAQLGDIPTRLEQQQEATQRAMRAIASSEFVRQASALTLLFNDAVR